MLLLIVLILVIAAIPARIFWQHFSRLSPEDQQTVLREISEDNISHGTFF
ncbi:MAG: hypothetical protein WC693_07150 [Patescibacteria group bacterium]